MKSEKKQVAEERGSLGATVCAYIFWYRHRKMRKTMVRGRNSCAVTGFLKEVGWWGKAGWLVICFISFLLLHIFTYVDLFLQCTFITFVAQ